MLCVAWIIRQVKHRVAVVLEMERCFSQEQSTDDVRVDVLFDKVEEIL